MPLIRMPILRTPIIWSSLNINNTIARRSFHRSSRLAVGKETELRAYIEQLWSISSLLRIALVVAVLTLEM